MSSIAASASAAPTAPVKAPPQAGILEGVNPVHFDKNHPIILFIVQVCCALLFRALLRKASLWDASPIQRYHHLLFARLQSHGPGSACETVQYASNSDLVSFQSYRRAEN